MKQLVKVHMLPTEDKTDILSVTMGKLTELRYIPLLIKEELSPEDYKIKSYQHLYFISDEKPKEGDWCILLDNHYINGGVGKYNEKKAIDYGLHNTKFFRKIVATTDKSLTLFNNIHDATIYLPQIPQSFIEEYVKAGSIDEVLLECEADNDHIRRKHLGDVGEGYNPETVIATIPKQYLTWKLKTDQNNCVIIHPVEPKLYTREEVIQIIYDSSYVLSNGDTTKEHADNWIKENLK